METKKRQLRNLLQRGGKYTAIELNEIIVSSDARKIISILRNEGWSIKDLILDDGHTKLYWITEDKRQLSLFTNEGDARDEE